jgi:hypothetical protein
MKKCNFAEKVTYCHLRDEYVDPVDCKTCEDYVCKALPDKDGER